MNMEQLNMEQMKFGFSMVIDNHYVECVRNSGDNNLNIIIYSDVTNLSFVTTFGIEQLTIQFTDVNGFYKMFTNAISKINGYSIVWELKDLRIIVNYEHEFLKFTQLVQFAQNNNLDNINVLHRYNMFKMTKYVGEENLLLKKEIKLLKEEIKLLKEKEI